MMGGIFTLFFTGPGLLILMDFIGVLVSTYTNYKFMDELEVANALIEMGSCFSEFIFFLIDCIIGAITAEFNWEAIVFWTLAGISIFAEV